MVWQGGDGHAGGGETLHTGQDLLFIFFLVFATLCVPRCLVFLVSVFLDVTRFLFLNCLRLLKEMIEKEMDNNLEVKVRAGELG